MRIRAGACPPAGARVGLTRIGRWPLVPLARGSRQASALASALKSGVRRTKVVVVSVALWGAAPNKGVDRVRTLYHG